MFLLLGTIFIFVEGTLMRCFQYNVYFNRFYLFCYFPIATKYSNSFGFNSTAILKTVY